MADTLGAVNPITYRGYVYDAETDLYYVSSRYYNSGVGRWVNADNIVIGVGGSVGMLVHGVPLAVGGDVNIIPDSTSGSNYLGVTTNIGIGTRGGEFPIVRSETITWKVTRFHIFDVAEDIYNKIMEW